MRKLKFHEQKLLKKVKFAPEWQKGSNLREVKILRRYHIQKREDYTRYNRICGLITSFVARLKKLTEDDPVRIDLTGALLEKCYNLGLIKTKKSLVQIETLSASKFCRRRLPVVMVRNHMAQNLTEATAFVEQGHIRVGLDIIRDPSFLLTRQMEDYLTWADKSSIKQKIKAFNGDVDDFELLGE
ncbi:putative U3 small nucleolar ribonucleoprotein IMP3 [Monocercomonoides exilis]|uniref:putative U3 small nucleolar ribonucleoprotein IMP3 n=1 Tax=Monocercomonoides exilis TaxID=2049356 RepID=UPI00355A1DFF|nr:putative U3 small nucleolar ribonucleoprotein IMP3 [Monocercomonoides exilis]|eukprot:MONOS_14506.1-p1 / transcript=MONOS_14506.1 / gene=MONOS_14506 / organism=Monocercomonoides_exilis_PA203 / gene_product=U3 small nucleolar ribonucleoprotein IMP3 / transcript_product=U3 small nucleolar ribonucleoprotein IMP3 / location=Mono_scaffold01015:3690-4433(+) / protein_length=184 / sequence_SO=supercontig / SO=protein_coding / is_pseudo=false